jgi:hypothetical protein
MDIGFQLDALAKPARFRMAIAMTTQSPSPATDPRVLLLAPDDNIAVAAAELAPGTRHCRWA